MQRKNSVLITRHRRLYKSGIALIMAITVIVTVATVLALALSMTNVTSKKTSDLYLYEQAAILTHSAAEYSVLRMSQEQPCSLKELNFKYNNIFDVNATMKYIAIAGSTCATNASTLPSSLYGTTTYPDSNGTVILDIAVSVTDTNITTEPIRYFRRTIQKL